MSWNTIRSFGATDYPAVRRIRDPQTGFYDFQTSTCAALTPAMRKKDRWYVAGWKIHLSVYPGEYARALAALRLFEALVEEHEKGAELSRRRADGETVAYKIFV